MKNRGGVRSWFGYLKGEPKDTSPSAPVVEPVPARNSALTSLEGSDEEALPESRYSDEELAAAEAEAEIRKSVAAKTAAREAAAREAAVVPDEVKTVKGINVKIVLHDDPDYGEILKVLPATVENMDVSSTASKNAQVLNSQYVPNLTKAVFSKIEVDDQLKNAFNKITLDKTAVSGLSSSYPSAAQIVAMIMSKQVLSANHGELLRRAQADIRSNGVTKWYEVRGSVALYNALQYEMSGKKSRDEAIAATAAAAKANAAFAASKAAKGLGAVGNAAVYAAKSVGQGADAFGTAAKSGVEQMKQEYIGNSKNLYKDSQTAITNFLTSNTGLKPQFVEGLRDLASVIKNQKEDKALGLNVTDELGKGIRSKLRRLTTNLNDKVKVLDGFPKWKMGYTTWKEPEEFEKDLLNRGMLGGKNTHKNKNTKRRKTRKH